MTTSFSLLSASPISRSSLFVNLYIFRLVERLSNVITRRSFLEYTPLGEGRLRRKWVTALIPSDGVIVVLGGVGDDR